VISTAGVPAEHGVSGERLALRIVNDLAELARVAERVDEFCAGAEIPADCAFKLNIALEELLTNTISYGYADAGRHEISLAIAREGDDLVAAISDDGQPFNPLEAAPPDLESPLEERRIGGLGVHLVKTMMDEVAYTYGDGRNQVTLRKRIAADPG
jgi:anti-sigma regulatory factor (Ser/Thr protein kinase)